MTKNSDLSTPEKIKLIKDINHRALLAINIIKKERDQKITNIMKDIDKKNISEVLRDIKNLE